MLIALMFWNVSVLANASVTSNTSFSDDSRKESHERDEDASLAILSKQADNDPNCDGKQGSGLRYQHRLRYEWT